MLCSSENRKNSTVSWKITAVYFLKTHKFLISSQSNSFINGQRRLVISHQVTAVAWYLFRQRLFFSSKHLTIFFLPRHWLFFYVSLQTTTIFHFFSDNQLFYVSEKTAFHYSIDHRSNTTNHKHHLQPRQRQ